MNVTGHQPEHGGTPKLPTTGSGVKPPVQPAAFETFAMTQEEAESRLPAEMPTTFNRMRDAAYEEARRIESGQTARMIAGFLAAPMQEQMTKRDDFLALTRLMDRIIADPVIIDRLKDRSKK
jgi:hypothetical protein